MQCNYTKKYLDEKGVSYKTINVEEDPAAYDYIVSRGFKSMPVIMVEGHKPFNGFRPDLLAKLG